jgi:hypothetical protein
LKTKLFVSLLLLLSVVPAYGESISDKTGLVNRLNVNIGEYAFEVETVSNFDIQNFKFDEEQKRLTLYISSVLENNLGEVIIPHDLLSGNFTFYLNDQEYFPKIKSNDKISFITLNFSGSGNNKLDIVGTNYLHESDTKPDVKIDKEVVSDGGGCLIATATYGSELSTQVQHLREIRDNKLLQTESGRSFMNSFNLLYYSFSPSIADYERENPMFKETVKVLLTPLISSLSILDYVSMDTEYEVLGYGYGMIMLNLGMYFVAPALLIVKLSKLKNCD